MFEIWQLRCVRSVPGTVYLLNGLFFLSENIDFKPIYNIYAIKSYLVHAHSSEYCVAVLHKHVLSHFVLGDSINI